MPELDELVRNELSEIILKIYVLGPDPNSSPVDEHDEKLRTKRVQIKDALIELGHDVSFPEDHINAISDPSINPMLAERILLSDAELIVVLAKTPGTLFEIGMLAFKSGLAQKSHIFMSEEFEGGAPHLACKHFVDVGGEFAEYTYPDDLDKCDLLSQVVEKIRRVQTAKYFA